MRSECTLARTPRRVQPGDLASRIIVGTGGRVPVLTLGDIGLAELPVPSEDLAARSPGHLTPGS